MTQAQLAVFTDMVDTNLQEKALAPTIARGVYNATTPLVRGAAVDILGTEDITIGQYNGTIVHQSLAGTKQTAALDKAPYFSVKLDGVKDLATAPANLKTFVSDKAGKTIALDMDTNLMALRLKAKTTVSGVKANISAVFTGVATALDIASVGMNDRAIVLDPATANMLVAEQGEKLQGEKASNIVYEGYIGKFMGIEVFKSNKVGASGTVKNCMAVDMSAIVLPRNYDEVRDVTSSEFFGVAVQGVMSYGIDAIETETGKSNRIVAVDVDHA